MDGSGAWYTVGRTGGRWRVGAPRLGGCPTAPRSKQHARGARLMPTFPWRPPAGAVPFTPHADPRLAVSAAVRPSSVHAPHVILPRRSRARPVAFLG
uniref:Uncharacterized protein n=1 Tax=Setaria italica TaxID=4555 RepID=K3XNL7_SETIT